MNRKHFKTSLVVSVFLAIFSSLFLISRPALAEGGDGLVIKAALSGLYECYQSGAYKSPLELSKYNDANSLVQKKGARKIYLPTGISETTSINCKEVLSGSGKKFAGMYSIGGITPPKSTGDVSGFLTNMGYEKSGSSNDTCLTTTYTGVSKSENIKYTYTNVISVCAAVDSNGKIQSEKMEVKYQTSDSTELGTVGTANNKVGESIKIKSSKNKITCQKHAFTGSGWQTIGSVKFSAGSSWSDFVSEFKSQGCAPEEVKLNSLSWTYTREGNSVETKGSEHDATFEIKDTVAAANKAISYVSKYKNYDDLKLDAIEQRTLLDWYLKNYYAITSKCGSGLDSSQLKGDGYIGPYDIVSDDGTIQSCYVKATKNAQKKVVVWDQNNHLGSKIEKTFAEILEMNGAQLKAFKDEQKQACNSAALSSRHAANALLGQSTTSEEWRQKAQKTLNELDDILKKTNTFGKDESEQIYWYEQNDIVMCYEYTDVNSQVSDPEPSTPPPVKPEGPGGSGEVEVAETPNCYNSASSLGWILCPTMDIVSKATQGAYGYVRDNFLEVKASMYSSDSPAHEIWKTIRNWGNIIFVILLLLVIFSQVTGIGLDNYSIKKVLPRLIMVVVLINLSFIICQLAIDVSNILGVELENLFGVTFANQIYTDQSFDLGVFLDSIIPTLFTLGGGAAFGAIVLATWDKWLIPLALFFLVTLIGVLFFAIMLAAREAAVIILAVLSPVAIVCYALPNTKKIYDRWFKMFSSMLLMFPICGALMGGGIMASRLLLATASDSSGAVASIAAIPLKLFADLSGSGDKGFFFQLVAVLIQVIPFFFVPTLTRSAFTAMGNLGNRIMGLRDRLSRSATGAIRGAEATKDWQQRMTGFNANRRANRFQENRDFRGRLGTWMNNRGLNGDRVLNSNGRNRAQTRAINAAGAYMLANQIADQTAEDGMEGIKSRQSAQLLKHFMDTYDNDADFKADLDEQGKAYNQALDELEADPDSQEARAKVRALQKFIGATADGQDKIKEVMYKRLYAEQQARGNNARVSRGMQFAAQTLVAENGGAFKSGDRGFSKAMKEMAKGENSNVFNGQFREVEHRNEQGEVTNRTYHNDAYGAESWKADASNLANANDTALADALAAINSGTMSANEIEDIYRNASDALANENIHVKSENESILNNIRRAAHNAMASSTSLYDTNGRLFNREANGQYKYVDDSNVEHLFTRAADGSLVEQGGSGMTVAADHIMTASDRFSGRYGSTYSDVHTGDSFKVQHNTPQARAHVALPPGVRQRPDGTFVNISTGNPLTGAELQRAQAITRANIEADIYNAQNGLTPPNP